MTKNIIVTDENGNTIGTTYPKRAQGLLRNGRALYVDDCTIRLSGRVIPSDKGYTEQSGEGAILSNQVTSRKFENDEIASMIEQLKSEGISMNYLYFNAREWTAKPAETENQGSGWTQNSFFQGIFQSGKQSTVDKSYINDFDGGLVESMMLGGWNEPCTEAVSKIYGLNAGETYTFVFWLNGGENDRRDEVCQLQIAFDTNPVIDNNYKLNRNFIKPLLHKQGWELYAIPFRVPENGSMMVNTRMAFIAGNAPMAVKPAQEPEAYKDWKDEPDEFAAQRPQRHNLVFEDGWPSIGEYGGDKYSTEALKKKKVIELTPKQKQAIQDAAGNVQQMAQEFAAKSKQVAKEFAQSTRQMAEHYKEKFETKETGSNGNVQDENPAAESPAAEDVQEATDSAVLKEEMVSADCEKQEEMVSSDCATLEENTGENPVNESPEALKEAPNNQ